MGYDHSKIVLDLIIMYPDHITPTKNVTDMNSIEFFKRSRDFKGFYTLFDDIVEFMRAYPDLQYRYFVQPSEQPEAEYDILNFDQKDI